MSSNLTLSAASNTPALVVGLGFKKKVMKSSEIFIQQRAMEHEAQRRRERIEAIPLLEYTLGKSINKHKNTKNANCSNKQQYAPGANTSR